MLGRLAARYHGHTFPYYFDIPFKETLIRHATKPNAHEFGEDQMRDWYAPMDTLGISGETIIGSDLSANDLVALILRETKI